MTAGLATGTTLAVTLAAGTGAYFYSVHNARRLLENARETARTEGEGESTDAIWAPGAGVAIEDQLVSYCAWSPGFGSERVLAIAEEPSAVFSAAYLQHFVDGSGFAWLDQQFAQNRLTAPPASIPMRIYQGDADETVLPAMTEELVAELQGGGADVELVTVAGGTHIDTAYGFLGVAEHATNDSVAWIRDHLEEP